MPNRRRRRGLTRPQSGRTVRSLPISILSLVPAIEQPRRHHVEWLEILMDLPKHFLEIRQNTAGELIYQERAIGMQDRVGLSEDGLPKRRWHRGVRNAREDVIGMVQPQSGKRRIGVGCGSVDDVQPVVLEASAQKAHEIGVGLQDNEHGVRPHPPQNLGRECAHPRPVLEEYSGSVPVHLRQDMVDQETGAGDQTPQHARVFNEIATEQ